MKRVQIIAILLLACAVMESYQLLGFHRHKQTDATCDALQDRCLTKRESTNHKCKKVRKMSSVCHHNRVRAIPCMNTCLATCDVQDNVFTWARCLLKCEKGCPTRLDTEYSNRASTAKSMSAETTCQWLSSQCNSALDSSHESWRARSTDICTAIEKDTGMCVQMLNRSPTARTCTATCLDTCSEHTGDFIRWKQCHQEHCLPCFTEHFRLSNPCDRVLKSCNDQASFAKPEDRIAAGLLCAEIKSGNSACNARLDDPSYGFCREQCAERCEGIHNAIMTWGQCLKDHCSQCSDRYGKYSSDFNPVIEQQNQDTDRHHGRDREHGHHGSHHGGNWIPEGRVVIPEEGPTRVEAPGSKHEGIPGMMKDHKERLNVCERITEQCRMAAPLASENLIDENSRFCRSLERNLSDCRAGVRLPMKERCGQVCMSKCENLASQDFYKWRICIEDACGECLQEVGGNVYREITPAEGPLVDELQGKEPGMDIPYNAAGDTSEQHRQRKLGWFDRIRRFSYLDRDSSQRRSHTSRKVHRNRDHRKRDHLFRDRDHLFRPNQQNQPQVPGDHENVIRNTRARWNY